MYILIHYSMECNIYFNVEGDSMSEQVFTTLQAATYMSVAKNTVLAWRAQGKGPKYMKLEGAVRYLKQDIDEWMREQTVTAGAERGGK